MGRFGSAGPGLVKKRWKIERGFHANQDSPLSEGMTPLLGWFWERLLPEIPEPRAEYVTNWWNVVKLEGVASRYTAK